MTGLDGKVIIVAGAAGAAGPPLVRRLVEHAATVVAVDRDENKVRALADDVGVRVVPISVDLLDEGATRALASQLLAEHGRVDGLLHLVGGWRGGAGIVESDLADWDWLHDVLIRTLQHTTRAFHDALIDSGGRLAIVSTTQAQKPTAKNASYAAAKAAAEAWTLACAHSFRNSDAAAVIVQVKALLTDAMREAKPEARFPGYTHVEDLAERLVGLWDVPAADLNGARLCLTP